VAGLIKQHFCY